jgi:flagellar hook-associated protein 1 FlgK
MSLGAVLASAISGLQVSQQALGVVATNVANTNTEGYSRKELRQDTLIVADRSAGVQASEIVRITDQFLTREIQRQRPLLGQSAVLQDYHARLQDYFGAPGDNRDLGTQIGGLLAAVEAFATQPGLPSIARNVLLAAEELLTTIDAMAGQIEQLRADADRSIANTVDTINSQLQGIAALNWQISRTTTLGQSSPDLLDQRDRLIGALSELMQISTFSLDQGAVAVLGAGGQSLVEGAARVLTYQPASLVAPGTVFDAIALFRPDQLDPATGVPLDPGAGVALVSGGVRATLSAELLADATPDAQQLITSRVDSGRLQGLLEMRDRLLPELRDQLQELADALRYTLNAASNAAVAWPPPATLTGTRTDLSGFATASRSGTATIAVIDQASGDTLHAFQVDVGTSADATALAVQVNSDLAGYGSATIDAQGRLSLALANSGHGLALAEGDSAIAVTDSAGRSRAYAFAHYFGLNDMLERTGASPLDVQVRPSLLADPAQLGAAQLDVMSGPPLAATLGGPGDMRGAQRLAQALRADQPFIARGGLAATTTTLERYAANLIGHAAQQATQAEQRHARDRAMVEALSFRAAGVAGVNLDEELARLIQLQQAYTTSARVVSMVDEMFDALLAIAR